MYTSYPQTRLGSTKSLFGCAFFVDEKSPAKKKKPIIDKTIIIIEVLIGSMLKA